LAFGICLLSYYITFRVKRKPPSMRFLIFITLLNEVIKTREYSDKLGEDTKRPVRGHRKSLFPIIVDPHMELVKLSEKGEYANLFVPQRKIVCQVW